MSTPATDKNFSIGFRHIDIFALNTYGTPAAASSDTSGVPYEGIHYDSARALNVTYPKPRQIIQPGDDSVEAVQVLPPIAEIMTAELQVGLANLDVIAAVAGVDVVTMGLSKFVSMATDQQGFEPYFGLLAFNQAASFPDGTQQWNWYMMPYTRVIATMPSMAETIQNIVFHLAPQIRTSQLWGEALTINDNGATRQQALWGISKGRPHLASWVCDAGQTVFTFNALFPAIDANSVVGFVNGVLAAGSASLASFTPTTPPTTGDRVDVWYEY